MVDLGIISQLVEFILCIFYDAVILTVIPECAEAIVFHLRIVMAAYVSVEEQVQSSKTVVAYALLIVVIIGITIIRCGICKEPFSSYYANGLFFCNLLFVCKLLFLVFMQDAPCLVCWFSRSFVSEACACFWGMFCERLCASRSLLGSYVLQGSI